MWVKIGIFGGSFNPFHKGHLNSLLTVCDKTSLDQVRVVPCHQSVDKSIPEDSPSSFQRLEMLNHELKDYRPQVIVDDVEVKRGGRSYTIDTINYYQMENPENSLYLIIGVDQFEVFDQWKDYETLLEKVNLIVTSRPGWDLSKSIENPPGRVKSKVLSQNFNKAWGCQKITLMTSREINFIDLKDVDLSSNRIRKFKRTGMSISNFVSQFSNRYIDKGKFYQNKKQKHLTENILEEIPKVISNYFYKDSAMTVLGFDLRKKQNYPSDHVFVVTTTSSIAGEAERLKVQAMLKNKYGLIPIGVEDGGEWAILDYGYIMIHFMSEDAKNTYNIISLFDEECLVTQSANTKQGL